jgi:hypothetical protein
MPKYNKTIIYKICCKNEIITDIYIGHTTDFEKRLLNHKLNCNNIKNSFKVYQYIRKNGGWNNWDMIKIEDYPCINKKEAEERERYWIENLKSSLNIKIPSRTKIELCEASRKSAREYYLENADKIKEYQKKYNIENADKVKEYHKEYYLENTNKIKEYQKKYNIENADKVKERHKEYYKEYYLENADKVKEQHKEYREQNADIIKEKAKKSITCECGCELRKDTFKRHQKSQKHKNLLEKLITNDGLTNSIVSN